MNLPARIITIIALAFISYYPANGQDADTVSVLFDLNDSQINPDTKKTIDYLLYTDAINNNKYMLIIGYADYLGDAAKNNTLSEARARSVQNYLLSSGIDKSHIKSCIGKGEISRTHQTKDGHAEDRKVEIVIAGTNKIFASVPTPPPPAVIKTEPVKPSKIATVVDSLKVGETFILKNIYFYTGRHTIMEESIPELNNLVKVMTDNPRLRIRIEGHVCCIPNNKDAVDEDVNPIREAGEDPSPYLLRTLSLNRARYIYHYLVSKGIKADRMEFAGYGRSRPLVAVEKSIEDEERNRRVEIRILNK